MKKLKKDFIKQFSKGQAKLLLKAARSHKNGIHDEEGKDPFSWAILLCLSYQCIEVDSFRKHHGITINYAQFMQFLEEHIKELRAHKGSVDYLGLFSGVYDFLKESD